MNFRSTMERGILTFLIVFTIVMTMSDVGAERIKLLPDSPLARGQKLVIGGRDAVRGQFPFQVSIQISGVPGFKDIHICGGSILNEHTILTAAHCVNETLREHYEIVAGNNKLKERHEKEQRRQIDRIFRHPNYKEVQQGGGMCFINDIALMVVREPFIFNDFVNATRLPEAGVYPTGDAQISGWGATTKSPTDEDERVATTLQVVKLPLLSLKECEAAMKACEARTLCTKPSHGDGTPWEGDSGGPLFQDEVVVGIVSMGETDSTLATYTRVSAFREWIDSIMTSRTNSNSKAHNEL